jgi:sporulation protein YqfC
MKKETVKKINNFLEMPREISSNEPKLTILGFNEMLIENYKGILEYENFYIRISTHIGTININGFNLNLTQMTEDDIFITGKIDSIDLETITDDEK